MSRARANLGVVLALVGVALILAVAGGYEVMSADRARGVVVGEVVSTSVEMRRNMLAREAWKRTYYVPIVVYAYEVGGVAYQNDVVWAGLAPDEESGTEVGAESVIAEYPVGASVQVFYDPDDPQDSVLRAESGAGWILIGMGGLVAVWAGLLVSRARRAEAIGPTV